MSVDVADLCAFYRSPLGLLASRLVGRVIAETWTDLRGLSLLGLGFAVPYLGALAPGCERALAFMPAAQGVTHWPGMELSATALVDPAMLPLAEGSVDRILVVHAIETVESPADLLHEVCRVLSGPGRAILICPNRRGLWARMDTTPFGQGQPFSRRQLRQLLRETSLGAERWVETLYVPPIASQVFLRSAGMWDRLGVSLSLPFAGLHVVEVVRHQHRPVLVRQRRRAPQPNPLLNPIPASRQALRLTF